MNDQELISEFFKTKRYGAHLRILVKTIHWTEGPHSPTSKWSVVRSLPIDAPEAVVREEIAGLIAASEYFGVCVECGKRNPRGWMHNDRICQSCAERNHGVVH